MSLAEKNTVRILKMFNRSVQTTVDLFLESIILLANGSMGGGYRWFRHLVG